MKSKALFMASILLALFTSAVHSEGNLNTRISKGIEYHNLARNTDTKKASELIDKCLECLEPYTASDALACAYYGSALTVKASHLSQKNPIKSLSYLEDGSRYLDKAVSMKSDDIELRIVRLENGIEVSRSSPVKRYGVIKADVDYLLKKEKLSLMSADFKAETYLYCGYYYQDSGDLETALDYFEMAVESDCECNAGKTAQKMLDKYSE